MSKKIGGKLFGGNVPRGKAGTRAVDHPSMGGTAKAGDCKNMPLTAHSGGKAHKSMGGGEGKSCPNPKPKCHAQGPQGKQAGGY